MNALEFPILSWIIFLPVIGVVVLLFIKQAVLARIIALVTSVAVFILFLLLYAGFDPTTGDLQFVEKKAWIAQFGIMYFLGTDGISLLLVGLTSFIWPLAILGSWVSITDRVKEYHIFMLLMEAALLGVFLSFDVFLFYIFWEAMLIPMCFLIGIWGYERRAYAAVKFFLFAIFGSLLMLVALITLVYLHYDQTGVLTFELFVLYQTTIPAEIQIWLAVAFLLAFAVKVPMFPFHTWLPDAIVLAVVIVKMAAYGFLRFSLPLFPETLPLMAPWICGFAVVGIIYGALVAFAQSDLKKLIAYSTVSHSGFIVLGVFALNQQGIQGAVLQIISLGLSTGGLFIAVMMLHERCNSWSMESYGGLWHTVPVYGAFLMVFTFASLGLPGLSNFIGEFLILVGAFQMNKILAVIAAVGVILAAVYMLRMYKRVMFGPLNNPVHSRIKDLTLREIVVCSCLTIMIFWIGVYPKPLLRTMDASVQKLLNQAQTSAQPAEILSSQEILSPESESGDNTR